VEMEPDTDTDTETDTDSETDILYNFKILKRKEEKMVTLGRAKKTEDLFHVKVSIHGSVFGTIYKNRKTGKSWWRSADHRTEFSYWPQRVYPEDFNAVNSYLEQAANCPSHIFPFEF